MSAEMGREVPSCPSPSLTQLFSSPTGFRNRTAQTPLLGGRRRPTEAQVTARGQKNDDRRGPGAAPGRPAAGRQVRRSRARAICNKWFPVSVQQLKCCQQFFLQKWNIARNIQLITANVYQALVVNQELCTLHAFKSFPSKVVPVT